MSMNGNFARVRGCSGTTSVERGSYSSNDFGGAVAGVGCAAAVEASRQRRASLLIKSVDDDGNARLRVLPRQRQYTVLASGRLHGNCECLQRLGEFGDGHLGPCEVLRLVVLSAPLAGLL